jgi:hypothetical protein
MDVLKRVRICDVCGKKNAVNEQTCICGNLLALIRPVMVEDSAEESVGKSENVRVENKVIIDKNSDEIKTGRQYRQCIVCGTKNYLENGKDVRKCCNCKNNELYKSSIQTEQNANKINETNDDEKKVDALRQNRVENNCGEKLSLFSRKENLRIEIVPGNVIGRMGDVRTDFFENQPHISKVHCKIDLHDGQWFVKDLDSTCGTRINGKIVKSEHVLQKGDLLSLANIHFEVEI